MRLHSPTFEQALRRGVKHAVKSSPELKREFRQANRFRKHYNVMLLIRPAISLGLAICVWQMFEKTGHIAAALGVINLWAFGFIFINAQRLIVCLYGSSDLPALALLPVAEPAIFKWELQKFFRGALWLLLDLLASYGTLAFCGPFKAGKWTALVPVSAAAWAEVLALAALGVVYLPRVRYQLVSSIFIMLVMALFFTRDYVGGAVISLIDESASSLNLLLPTGWPASIFQVLFDGGHWFFLVLLLPLVAVVWTLKSSFQLLLARYQFQEPLHPEAPDLVPGRAAELRPTEAMRMTTRFGPTAIEEVIQCRQFLMAPVWDRRGWFESSLWKLLNARERALIEFVFPNGVNIAAPWKKIFRNLAFTVLAAVGAGYVGPVARFWALLGGLFVTFCQVLAEVLSTGQAFRLVACSGVNIPIYAGYAIGFRELARVLFKYSIVQLPLVISFAVFAGILVCQLLNLPLAEGALIGLKAGGLLLVSRFIFVTFAFSAGTNDTSMLRFRSLVLLLLVVAFCLGFVGLAAASLFVPRQQIAWLLWGFAAVEAYAFFRVYGWFYHTNRFDLMSLPRR